MMETDKVLSASIQRHNVTPYKITKLWWQSIAQIIHDSNMKIENNKYSTSSRLLPA